PYKRPNSSAVDLLKIKTQNKHDHALGVGLLAYKLKADALELVRAKLQSAFDNLEAHLDDFQHADAKLLCQHNLMCAHNLLEEFRNYVGCLVHFNPGEYQKLTGWISDQWQRLTDRRQRERDPSRFVSGGITMVD
ncbi:MAG: hypothetical protein ACREJM_01860, partial [Candidatus Saccharimonadales bacterium]